jgi:hypothetical protein
MLNLTDIAQRIAHPEKCEISDFEDLKTFATQYPYCQVFPILSLKALSNNNDLRFDAELSYLAYRISDRTQLYSLIHQNVVLTSEEKSIQPEEEKVETTPPLRVLRAEENNIEETNHPEVEAESEEQKATTEHIDATSENKSEVLDELEDENDSEFIPLNISSNEVVIVPEEIQQDEEAIASEIETPVLIEEEEPTVEELVDEVEREELDAFERSLLAETFSSAYKLEELAPEENESSEDEEMPILDEEEETSEQNRSFSDWLKVGNQSSSKDIEEDKSNIDDLLDRFIENEPKISRPTAPVEDKPKRPFYSPEKKAKESVDMQHMPVSETLGKIFELQGNYPKAIFVYEQLLLANPEKKSYFAARIEELNKKINS